MTQTTIEIGIELTAVALSLGMLGGYRLWLSARLARDPLFTIQAYHRHVRQRWAIWILQDSSRGLLAVQTLRNSTMGATFLASTVLLLLGGSLSLVGRPEALGIVSHSLVAEVARHPIVWNIKVLTLVGDLFVAIFAFIMSVRLYTHLGYQLSLPPEAEAHGVSVTQVTGMLDRAGILFSLGLRACYLAMPLVLWLFGPILLVVSCAVLIVAMAGLDRNRVAAG